MKKLFTILAVVMFAVAANAEVLFEETFATRRGSTFIVKAKTSQGGEAWPYASQWFTGYEAKDASKNVVGNQYDNDYDEVSSYTVSVRTKKLDGSADYSVGLFFGASKAEADNYVKFEGALPAVAAGAKLKLVVCSSETDGGDLSTMVVKVNDEALTVPATTLGNKCVTSTVEIALPAGQINSLNIAFNNVPAQKFISNIKIESGSSTGIENVALTESAKKVVVDGVVYIVRDGKMFNLTGAQVR